MNATTSNRFIDIFFGLLRQNDAVSLGKLINIKNEQYKNIYFNESSLEYLDNKIKSSPNEIFNWSEVIQYYVLARNSLKDQDIINAFEFMAKSFTALIGLIKDAKDENWQLPVLFRISVDLRLLAYACDSAKQKQQLSDKSSTATSSKDANGEGGSGQDNEYAEKTAENLMASFRKLCTDTR
jgi:hypothetical protein